MRAQRATDGTLTAFDAILAAPSSIPMPIYSYSVMAPLSAIIAPTVAAAV